MSFVRIEHIQSGAVLYDGPEPETETGSIEEVTDFLIGHHEIERVEADGHIPAGCGEYRTETRRTAEYQHHTCWEALDWFSA